MAPSTKRVYVFHSYGWAADPYETREQQILHPSVILGTRLFAKCTERARPDGPGLHQTLLPTGQAPRFDWDSRFRLRAHGAHLTAASATAGGENLGRSERCLRQREGY
jgi:hypothetical protein